MNDTRILFGIMNNEERLWRYLYREFKPRFAATLIKIFPFRFTGEGSYMIYFDVLIAFTYAFHIHSFIRQTRFTQQDIQNCGKLRSVLFITWIHLTTLSIIMAIPRGGVLNAFHRIFWKYPVAILTDPQWVLEYIMHPTRYPLF